MKKLILSCCVAGILLPFAGCKKLLTYAEEHGEPYIVPGHRISAIINFSNSPADSIMIHYNSAGNPITIFHSVSPGDTYDYLNFILQYDSVSGRLTDLIGLFGDLTSFPDSSDNSVATWNKFFYNSAGDIVLDSAINFPLVLHGKPYIGEHGIAKTVQYGYDSLHRIVSVKNAYVAFPDTLYTTFSYDNSGNLAGGHDDKINPYRTNKIWQFLNLDYSVNNSTSATYTYNSSGLPVTFIGPKTFISASAAGRSADISNGKFYYTGN